MAEGAADPIALIRQELFRLRARPEDVGPVDGITVAAYAGANATLQSSPHGIQADSTSPRSSLSLDWVGSVEEILERLRGLPDDAGSEAVRSEFREGR